MGVTTINPKPKNFRLALTAMPFTIPFVLRAGFVLSFYGNANMSHPCPGFFSCRTARWLLAACLLLCACARADVIHLKNGKTLRGEVVKEDETHVTVRVPFGEIKLKKSDIEAIERQTPQEYRMDLGRQMLAAQNYSRAVALFEEAYLAQRDNLDAKRILCSAYELLGKNCRELHRFSEAREALSKLLKLDPDGEMIPHKAAALLKTIQAEEQDAELILNKASQLAAAQEWSKAIVAFEELITYTADARIKAGPPMARCHVHRAAELCKAGKIDEATANLESALKYDPALADSIENFYTSCALPGILNSLERGEIPAARTALKRVLSFAPANPSVLYAAGRLEEALGKFPNAADCYAHALRMRTPGTGRDTVKNLRQTLEKNLNIQGERLVINTDFAQLEEFARTSDGPAQKFESDHFIVFHYNETLARQVAGAAEYHRDRIASELSLTGTWRGKAKIFLHRTQQEYTAATAQPEWTGGSSKFSFSGGQIHDPQVHSWQTSPRLLKSVLPHEIAHLVVNANLGDAASLPKSLHEGFAVLMEPRFRQDYFLNFLRVRLKSQDFIPLADLLIAKDYPRDPEFFYAEGFAILQFICQEKGATSAVPLLKAGGGSGAVQAELLKISGSRSVEELEAGWKKWILGGEKK
jgi:tetratricopeptide (TPR) repeat protein